VRLTIKTRVVLLALVVLGGMLSIAYLLHRASSSALREQAALIALLGRTDHIALMVHELQRERGLASSYLAGRDERFLTELQTQYIETDRRLGAATTDQAQLRQRVLAMAATPAESFDFYTARVAGLLLECKRLSLSSRDAKLQQELVAQVHLIFAKEFLGQVRGTLLSARAEGPAAPGWQSTLGARAGLFEWHYGQYRQVGAVGDAEAAALQDARRILAAAMLEQNTRPSAAQRREWFRTLTAAVDHLYTLERDARGRLEAQALATQDGLRARVRLERVVFLAAIGALSYLALSSLRLILNALEASLRAARRALAQTNGQTGSAHGSDEVGEISHGMGSLLGLVDQLNLRATTDPLTGALNRQGMSEIAGRELERARRHGRALALIAFDLDHFKRVNDQYGHAAGDDVLKAMAGLVRGQLRRSDAFARWGGEEFIVLVPEASAMEAQGLADKLRKSFRESHSAALPAFTASFGVTTFVPGDSLDSLCARADQALYAAKAAGRDRVVVSGADPA